MKYYKISESDLRSLLQDSAFLACLYINGLDNWEGHKFAIEDYNKEQIGDYNKELIEEELKFFDVLEE